MKWLRDSLNGTVSSSFRSGCKGGSPSSANRPPANDKREIAEPACGAELTLQPRILGSEIRIIDRLSSRLTGGVGSLGSAALPLRVDNAIVGLAQPLTEAHGNNDDRDSMQRRFPHDGFSVTDDSMNVSTRSASAESSDVGSGRIHRPREAIARSCGLFLPLALKAAIWRAPALRDCDPGTRRDRHHQRGEQ